MRHLKAALLPLSLIGVFAMTATAQKFEIHPYAGGFFSGKAAAVLNVKNQPMYGIKGGMFLNKNFEVEGHFGYIDNLAFEGTLTRKKAYIWEGLATYNLRRLYGAFGERFVTRLAEAIRGTVNGTIFVALSEGALIGLGYGFGGLAHPFAFTVVTIGFALIPFGAWAAFGVASLFLILQGQTITGALLFGYGSAVMLTGDNLVQPALIGNSIRLPFLWTFVGIFGGMYSFGLVGLFIGPAIMAALFLVWSEWQGREPPRGRRARKSAA